RGPDDDAEREDQREPDRPNECVSLAHPVAAVHFERATSVATIARMLTYAAVQRMTEPSRVRRRSARGIAIATELRPRDVDIAFLPRALDELERLRILRLWIRWDGRRARGVARIGIGLEQ